jgi:hypothetical protein
MITLLDLSKSTLAGQMAVEQQITALKAFDAFPNTIFLGLELNKVVTFRILLPDKSIQMENAHFAPITDIESAKINE